MHLMKGAFLDAGISLIARAPAFPAALMLVRSCIVHSVSRQALRCSTLWSRERPGQRRGFGCESVGQVPAIPV